MHFWKIINDFLYTYSKLKVPLLLICFQNIWDFNFLCFLFYVFSLIMIKCGHTSLLIESTLTEQKKTMQSCWYLAKLLVSHQLGFWKLDLMRRESVMFFTWVSVNICEFLMVWLGGDGDELQNFDFQCDVFPVYYNDSRWIDTFLNPCCDTFLNPPCSFSQTSRDPQMFIYMYNLG